MQEAPDRPRGMPGWAVVALAVAVTAGAGWWILQGDSKSTPQTKATSPPCQPGSRQANPSASSATSSTADWAIAVTSARAEPTVEAQDGGTYRAAPGEVFVVVAVTFRNLHPGTEAPVSTSLVRLECSDGTKLEMAGFDDGQGFCRVCALDLGTSDRRVRWAFIFRMERANLAQPFWFLYGAASPIDLALAA